MNTNPEVDQFLKDKNHPMMDEIQSVRKIILEADPNIKEAIKWKSPTFIYKGNIASFFMNAKKFVSLMFHKGALIQNTHGLLDGDGKEARVARFTDMDDITEKKEALVSIIKDWIRLMDSKT